MPEKTKAPALGKNGSYQAILVYIALMVGLKIIDILVQDDGILSPSWRWPLIAGLGGGVYVSILNAYRQGARSVAN